MLKAQFQRIVILSYNQMSSFSQDHQKPTDRSDIRNRTDNYVIRRAYLMGMM